MSNTINVNYMTRAYNQYQQKNAAKDQEKEDTRFADSVREKSEASGSIVEPARCSPFCSAIRSCRTSLPFWAWTSWTRTTS